MAIHVRYRSGEKDRTVPIEQWLRDNKNQRPLESIDWVFAGSKTWDDGRFGADVDGTVICVVDFETALIAVGALHSADNELLWLEANTERIPKVGTPCTLMIGLAPAKTGSNRRDTKEPKVKAKTAPSDPPTKRAPKVEGS